MWEITSIPYRHPPKTTNYYPIPTFPPHLPSPTPAESEASPRTARSRDTARRCTPSRWSPVSPAPSRPGSAATAARSPAEPSPARRRSPAGRLAARRPKPSLTGVVYWGRAAVTGFIAGRLQKKKKKKRCPRPRGRFSGASFSILLNQTDVTHSKSKIKFSQSNPWF